MRTDRLIYALLWLTLLGYALLGSPPPAPDAVHEVTALALADTTRVDPIATAVFNLLGVLPTAFLAILLYDTGRPGPWPFALGAYVLGGIILLPYLMLRDTRHPLRTEPGRFISDDASLLQPDGTFRRILQIRIWFASPFASRTLRRGRRCSWRRLGRS